MNLLGILFFTISTICSILFTAAHSLSDVSPDGIEGRVIGGQTSAPHRYPYMVSLQMRFLWVRAHFCGGSLINKNWVVTAGHCVTESWLIRWLNIDAVAGAHDVDNFNKDVQIQKIVQRIEHHNYRGGIGPNDIAVLKTERPFVFTNEVQPIPLPPENVELSRGSMILTGWGALNTNGYLPVLPSKLQELNVTYVPYNKCNDQLVMFLDDSQQSNPLDEDSNICSGPLDGGKAACVGDSGGPLVLITNAKQQRSNEKNEYDDDNDLLGSDFTSSSEDSSTIPVVSEEGHQKFLVGVVSWGVSPCGETGAPTVYTDVTKYLDFINSYVNT